MDGQDRGATPGTLAVSPGRHEIVVRTHDAIDEARTIEVDPAGSTVALSLWRDPPDRHRPQAALPGTTATDARFLEDGRLALQVALPDGARQACARPIRWVCPSCALVLGAHTITVEEDRATGHLVVRCSSCAADAWG